MINASGARTHLVHLEGHRLRVTHTDGNALQVPVEVDVIPIAPAERYDVEFTANRPGCPTMSPMNRIFTCGANHETPTMTRTKH